MYKTTKDNKIIFKPGSWVSKKCVIVPNEKVKKKIIWFNRLIAFLYLVSLVVGGLVNSWSLIVGLILLFSVIQVLYLRKLLADFDVTDETITFKDSANEYSKKTSDFNLWLLVIVCPLIVMYLARKLYMASDDIYYNLGGIILFTSLFAFVLYAIKIKKHNNAVR